MGEVASRLADVAWLTSDNPRTENALSIIEQVKSGMNDVKPMHVNVDRKESIAEAVLNLQAGDWLVVAGKGHEDYQIVGTEKHHLDDREEVRKAFALRSKNS